MKLIKYFVLTCLILEFDIDFIYNIVDFIYK